MPVPTSYPGVYIEEIGSGVHTVTGVATSITAFIGRAPRGPAKDPVTITSFADFERTFGGLVAGYPMGHAVRDFYLNGGQQAVIVRVVGALPVGERGTAGITLGPLALVAASPGLWGNNLLARVDYHVLKDVADRYGLTTGDLFNLSVRDTGTGLTERFLNLTVRESPRRVDRVLKSQSSLVAVSDPATLLQGIPPANTDPDPGKDPWDKDHSTAVTAAATSESPTASPSDLKGDPADKNGIYALDKVDLFNLLCIPPDQVDGDTNSDVYNTAMGYCVARRALLIVDAPASWTSANLAVADPDPPKLRNALAGKDARNAAIYFPRVVQADPLRPGQPGTFAACGIVAGIMARTDATRGVWKAPAGTDASLNGVQGLSVSLTNDENGLLNPLGVNCLRTFPVIGTVVWGARTLRGADQLADEYKYVPVRRLALFIEESLYRGTQWVVFEPNDEPLWSSIRLNVGAFMHNLFRQGAFEGQTPQDAYFVKCDKETTIQNDIDLGIVNIRVGFAPLKPAEFVVIQIQQIAGQVQV
jgi:phage tail sheath protein FI